MKNSLLEMMASLSVQELYQGLYTDALTGVLNRRAFELDGRPLVAMVDLDSLKFVNDELGHRRGDSFLRWLGRKLVEVFGEDSVYRMGGDEFAIKADNALFLRRKLVKLQTKSPYFSFGVGTCLRTADLSVKTSKLNRENEGSRASRGEQPVWFGDVKDRIERAGV